MLIAHIRAFRRRGDGDIIIAAFSLWLIPSVAQIVKFTGDKGLIVLPFAGLAAIGALTLVVRRRKTDWPAEWLIAVCGLMVLAFAALYPFAHSGLFGRGSDRDDALNVSLHALLGLHAPYGMKTFLGNAPTPMPGALLLALPFYLLGNAAFQNLLWAPLFVWWARTRLGATAPAVWCALIFVLGCPASLQEYVSGGDYLINAMYVAMAMDLVFVALQKADRAGFYIATIFLGVAISSRPVYGLAVPILAGAALQFGGRRRLLLFLALLISTCALLNGPIYLLDPANFPLFPLARKVGRLPAWLHAAILLPAVAALIGCLSFRVRLDRGRIQGLMALSLAVIFYPVIAFSFWAAPHRGGWLGSVGYALPVSIFGGLWLSSRLAQRWSQTHDAASKADDLNEPPPIAQPG